MVKFRFKYLDKLQAWYWQLDLLYRKLKQRPFIMLVIKILLNMKNFITVAFENISFHGIVYLVKVGVHLIERWVCRFEKTIDDWSYFYEKFQNPVGVLSGHCHLLDQRSVAKDLGTLSKLTNGHHNGSEYVFLEHQLSELDRVPRKSGGSDQVGRIYYVSGTI
jgi:hypothetical protein